MSQATKILKALGRATLLLVAFALALLGLFVAWWIVVFALLGIAIYVGFRRLTGRGVAPRTPRHPGEPPGRGEVVVIEGEYRVEHDAGARAAPLDRGKTG
ncbi:MAG: hypothetical protein IT514_03960 [Burkholderiales bacterium]|nr:hypothetical protein [Burkholderiales bacterium]